jgi:hypothetical protein
VIGSLIQSLKEEKNSLYHKNNGTHLLEYLQSALLSYGSGQIFISRSHKFLSNQQKENPLRQTEEQIPRSANTTSNLDLSELSRLLALHC